MHSGIMEQKHILDVNKTEEKKNNYNALNCNDKESDHVDKSSFKKEIFGMIVCMVGCIISGASAVCVKKLNGAIPDLQVGRFSCKERNGYEYYIQTRIRETTHKKKQAYLLHYRGPCICLRDSLTHSPI